MCQQLDINCIKKLIRFFAGKIREFDFSHEGKCPGKTIF